MPKMGFFNYILLRLLSSPFLIEDFVVMPVEDFFSLRV